MRIEKIETNKVRVTISTSDLAEMNINMNSLRPDSPQLHGFLFKIMECVERETGFNPGAGQIVIEAVPSDDGIVLVVTKLMKKRHMHGAVPKVRAVRSVPDEKIFVFEDFAALYACFNNIKLKNMESARLYSIGERYYLLEADVTNKNISEFARACRVREHTKAFIAERGKLIARGEKLISMIEGIKNLK